jgi:hypothetical protein
LTVDEPVDYTSRLYFLYKAVDDTQNSIRFIDTKAAFCVTLLSGMVAVALRTGSDHVTKLHRIAVILFLVSVALTLLICLRVIFPVIKPPNAPSPGTGRSLPKYFIPHRKEHRWRRHIFSGSVENVLADDHRSYSAALLSANDADIFLSMCDELLMVSLIRQIKSDRLQAAMFLLVLAIVFFFAAMAS